jgi:hypothetical protein
MDFPELVLIELLQFTNLRSKPVRPSDPNQQASIRPNLMSSSKRGTTNEGKILAALESGSGTARNKQDRPPVTELWRKGRNSLLLVLCVCLVWFTYDNATSFTFGPAPVAVLADPKSSESIAVAQQTAPITPPAAAVIREERIAAPAEPVRVAGPAAPMIPAIAPFPSPERIALVDRAKPVVRPPPAKKSLRPAPAASAETAPPDNDVAILSAIVAQGHAAKAASGR